MNLNYSINGISFLSLGIGVSESPGLLDGLELKEPFSVNWPDSHGEVVDLYRPRFQPREIKLSCFLIADNASDFVTKLNALTAQLVLPGTQRLRLDPIGGKPLVYEVYSRSGFSVDKKWRDGKMIGKFTLSLTEPQPVKWVLSALGGTTVTLVVTASSPITFYWGDGTSSEALDSQTVTHTYSGTSATTYYVIVSGELERLAVISKTNLTEIWSRLY